ncbi:trigger factor [Pseudoxanthomonas broegbernensis]|uniref:Trigger factor n=1 Tax=Pseudoxanthomonas broegbernensis TaxID=83619 RepID=A0A7V8GP88_9GAMM|nr:trigger factor [Pseudoxanthomonas broegbernensis]KAF1687487.1 trigger factor [Pseudoxanthomonas broegbernensis]MBB6064490.1 trigger factor [Pseudoxanthomonas broegbernensis]
MQVSVESTGNLERRMNFSLPAEQLESGVSGRLREIARTVRIKGFRPGKVPAKVVEQRYGEQVKAEVLNGLLRQAFDSAVREHDLRPAGNPRIDRAGEGELDFTATFEIVPDFGDVDVSKLTVVRHTAEVADADIDQMIENLRLQRRTWNKVEREAKEGDLVAGGLWTQSGDFRQPAEGEERFSTVIGSAQLLPALEAALAGLQPGVEHVLDVAFPENWRQPQLAGKTAQVHVTLAQVSEPVLPEVDAAFIKSFGVKSGQADKFREDIRTNLERELRGALMTRLRREVGEQLTATWAHVELPPRLVENEARGMLAQQVEQVRRSGRDPGQPPANAHEQFLEAARKRVLAGLLVGEVARRHDLRLDPKRVNETLRLIASTYEEPEQVIEMYRNDPQLMQGLQARVMEEQVIDWISERAQRTEQALSFQEAIRG